MQEIVEASWTEEGDEDDLDDDLDVGDDEDDLDDDAEV